MSSLWLSSTLSHFHSTTTRSTTWRAWLSPRRHCTPNTSSRTCTVDKAALKKSPRTNTPTGYEPKGLATSSGSTLEDIYQLFDVQRIWRTRSTSSNYWISEGIWCVPIYPDTKLIRSRSGRDVTCWEDVPPPVPNALRRVYGKHCGLWSPSWRVTKVAGLLLNAHRASGKPDAIVVQERGKCTSVSFIRRS